MPKRSHAQAAAATPQSVAPLELEARAIASAIDRALNNNGVGLEQEAQWGFIDSVFRGLCKQQEAGIHFNLGGGALMAPKAKAAYEPISLVWALASALAPSPEAGYAMFCSQGSATFLSREAFGLFFAHHICVAGILSGSEPELAARQLEWIGSYSTPDAPEEARNGLPLAHAILTAKPGVLTQICSDLPLEAFIQMGRAASQENPHHWAAQALAVTALRCEASARPEVNARLAELGRIEPGIACAALLAICDENALNFPKDPLPDISCLTGLHGLALSDAALRMLLPRWPVPKALLSAFESLGLRSSLATAPKLFWALSEPPDDLTPLGCCPALAEPLLWRSDPLCFDLIQGLIDEELALTPEQQRSVARALGARHHKLLRSDDASPTETAARFGLLNSLLPSAPEREGFLEGLAMDSHRLSALSKQSAIERAGGEVSSPKALRAQDILSRPCPPDQAQRAAPRLMEFLMSRPRLLAMDRARGAFELSLGPEIQKLVEEARRCGDAAKASRMEIAMLTDDPTLDPDRELPKVPAARL